ncbi:lysosomal Pro-X carboxypeptidase-like [Diorhabda sublineata]|uniref:lysosomal Pro-X carboxypeptidase-like n=1 Tax=Diorhabda sublineata TaxID=1163346 RepID=UPI0024E13155|nr:lysosomal Pro-X carboxypeptidase-like [Diorhabda sublineata]
MNCQVVWIVSVFIIVPSEGKYLFKTNYIDVPLDHFSYTSNAIFKLRYLINDTYLKIGGPIFFYTGNEGDITNFAQNTGFMFDIAPQFNALLVFAEHRYYGQSLPFGNESYSTLENLGYLSSQQALADYVYLIEQLQKDYINSKSFKPLPVIAFGGSYGGMLAAWIRMRYPSSVLGSIASSAPIWQFNGLTPCENFNRITTTVYTSYGTDKCTNTIKKVWATVRNFAATPTGKTNISSLWKLCTPISTDKSVESLIEWVAEILVNMAMANYPYANNFLTDLPAYPILEFCRKLNNQTWKDDVGYLTAIGESLQIYTNYTGKTKCNSINKTSTNLGENGWFFQSCTDMIMPMCSTDLDMFENESWDFQKYSDDCYKQFKIRPRDPNVPIREYGGKEIGAASNIIFSNGLLDPWSSGGVLRNINDDVRAVFIPDGAHHYDLRGKNDNDTGDVKDVRRYHIHKIEEWIQKYYNRPHVDIVRRNHN